MRETRSRAGGVEGRGRGLWRHAPPASVGQHPALAAVAATRRLFLPRKYDIRRQDFWPPVPLTLQGVKVGGRPLGVVRHVLAGQDEVRRGADGAAGLLPGPVQPHVPQRGPAPVRAQPEREYRHFLLSSEQVALAAARDPRPAARAMLPLDQRSRALASEAGESTSRTTIVTSNNG